MNKIGKIVWVPGVTLAIFGAVFTAHAQSHGVLVDVVDPAGSSVAGAVVQITDRNGTRECAAAGTSYRCTPETGRARITVTAEGFASASREISSGDRAINVALAFAGVDERVVVSALRTEARLGDTPASISVVSSADIESSAAPVLDDVLRQVPGFSTFRRSSSRNSNPTTQGVSMRGAGATGASRSLVLLDGLPLNDPFGGWVQWNRVPPVAVDQVEVVRGGASSLYGSGSLSGTLNVIPRRVDERYVFSAEAYGGTQATASGSAFFGTQAGRWSFDGTAAGFRTRGYIPVESGSRGDADHPAGVRSAVFSATARRDLAKGSLFVRPSYFAETRNNGTQLQTNQTHSRQIAAGGDWRIGSIDRPTIFTWRVYGGNQLYDQTFTAVSADRSTETLSRLQRSPSQNAGFSAVVTHSGWSHTLVAGVEGRDVRGFSDEVGYFNANVSSYLGTGGRERSFGVFVGDAYSRGRFVLAGSLRFDRWMNENGLSLTRVAGTGATTLLEFPDRSEQALSPRISILVRIRQGLSTYGAFSRSFRAPTLNELYRGFRVGNVLTNANADLTAERATTGEGGLSFTHRRFSMRANVFVTKINDAIGNVTLAVTPALITRQRQNAGATEMAGFETDAEWRIADITLNAGYLFVDSTVAEFPSNPLLVNKRVPQVPRHQATAQIRYVRQSWAAAVQMRASGSQFDDDLNTFRLEPFFQMDAQLTRSLGERLKIFAAVENVFNSRYSIGRTPLRTISSPSIIRLGVRWN